MTNMKDKSTFPELIDVNAFYGRGAKGVSDFPSLGDRLDFMDRLGISRAVVWNVESQDNHALSSNRKMLEDIAATPRAQRRIIPALTVSGLMHYEQDGVKELRRQMTEGGTRALRFVNVFKKMSLYQLDPVIREIQDLSPLIVMRHDESTVREILDFTETFPDVPLVITEVIWGLCITVYDLMRRRKNIILDNSWLHTFGSVELVVERFGAERLVLGTGYKAHGGAAVGQIVRADIEDAQKTMVMSGNLRRLLKIEEPISKLPVAARSFETGSEDKNEATETKLAKSPDSLWAKFITGRPLGTEIVDAHFHIGPSAGYVLKYHDERDQIDAALKAMDALGIRTAFVSGMRAIMGDPVIGNKLLEELLMEHRERFKGYLAFNPLFADELAQGLDRHFAKGFFAGFKTLCAYWKVKTDDPRLAPMWEYANKHRLPILNHTWGTDDVANLAKVVGKYPKASFILGHSGGSDEGRAQAQELAANNKNVYLEWCGSFCSSTPWEYTLSKVPASQVLFGSDAMVHDINWELARLLSLDVPDSTIIPILGQNMRRIIAI